MTRLLLAAAMALIPAAALAASPIEGNWANPARSVTVRIAPCGDGTWCGRVIAASAKARDDAAAKGTDKLIGTELLSGLQPDGEGGWHGQVFVPDINRRAEADVHLIGPRTLEVKGCAVGGFLCKAQNWSRVGAASKGRRKR